MGLFSAVSLLTFALCFVACVYASPVNAVTETEPPEVSKGNAEQAVSDAKTSITKVNSTAESEVTNAKDVLSRVETSEAKAREALSQAEKTAKENEGAKTIVSNIKSIFNRVSTLYLSAKEQVEKTNASLMAVLKEAEQLKTECDTEEDATKGSTPNYSDIKNKATQIKNKADKLVTNITDASTIISGLQSTAQQMEESAKEVQLKKIQIICIVAVAEIETKVGEANGIITNIQTQKRDVNKILKEMETLKTKASNDFSESFDALIKSANDALTNVTLAVQKTEQAERDMTTQKEIAAAALVAVQKVQSVNTAEKEEIKAEACVDDAAKIVLQLTTALQIAKDSVKNAKVLRQEMETALLKATSAPSAEEVKETKKSDPQVGEDLSSHQKDATTQPTSKDALRQSENSADKQKDALINSAQNVPTTALTGEKTPAPGAKNDSAMTVSVPLLVALIASAVLQ